jgi:hypothetical protein
MHNIVVDVLETGGLGSQVEVVKAHHPTSPKYLRTEGSRRKYVYVARDFRDTIVSDITLYDLPNSFPRTAAMSLLPEALRSYKFWRRQPEFYQTTYDALIGDIAGHAAEVAEFLGVDISDAEAEQIAERHSAKNVQHKVAAHYAAKPEAQAVEIDSEIGFRPGHFQGGETGKWARSLSPWQVAFIEFHARSWLLEHGFELSQPRYRQILAGLVGAPFMLAGRAVVKTKLLLGRAEIN